MFIYLFFFFILLSLGEDNSKLAYRAFSLPRPASLQIYWNKRMCLNKKRVQLPQDWCETPTWPQPRSQGSLLPVPTEREREPGNEVDGRPFIVLEHQ